MPAMLPGPVRQNGYVVRDFDATLDWWVAAGVGPWFVIRDLPQKTTYRGEPCEVALSIGFANAGDMQVEVIAQAGATPSIFTEFLTSGREGFHQLAWWVDDFEAALRVAEDAGWPVVWSGGGDGLRFTYVEPPAGPAAVFEIVENTEMTTTVNSMIREAAVDWDGSDPIRTLL